MGRSYRVCVTVTLSLLFVVCVAFTPEDLATMETLRSDSTQMRAFVARVLVESRTAFPTQDYGDCTTAICVDEEHSTWLGGKRYGFFCGRGYTCTGRSPVDEVDACCEAHDSCIGHNPYGYEYSCSCNMALVRCMMRSSSEGFAGCFEAELVRTSLMRDLCIVAKWGPDRFGGCPGDTLLPSVCCDEGEATCYPVFSEDEETVDASPRIPTWAVACIVVGAVGLIALGVAVFVHDRRRRRCRRRDQDDQTSGDTYHVLDNGDK